MLSREIVYLPKDQIYNVIGDYLHLRDYLLLSCIEYLCEQRRQTTIRFSVRNSNCRKSETRYVIVFEGFI